MVNIELQKEKKPTLHDLLHSLAAMDELLTTEIDPAKLVGDLHGKVDSIKAVIDRLDAFTEYLTTQIEPLERAAVAATVNAKRLKDYVVHEMISYQYEQLPGETWRIRLQNNPSSVEFTRPPTADDYLKMPGYVEMVRSYEWKRKVVKDDLELGLDLEFAKLKSGKHVRFYLRNEKAKRKNVIDIQSTQEPKNEPKSGEKPANQCIESVNLPKGPASGSAPEE